MNSNSNQLVTHFYDALMLVQYPGIAQVDVHNFKSCFLSENNIFLLLRWLYIKGLDKSNSTDESLNHTQGNGDSAVNAVDEKFIMKWYSQAGICTSEKALRGQCQLKDQLDTFINLTDYIINVLLHSKIEGLSELIAWNIVEKYFANQINFIPLSYKPNKIIRVDYFNPYIKNLKNNIKTENNVNEELKKKELKSFISEAESSSTIVKSESKKNQTFILVKFCKDFKNFENGISPKMFVRNEETHNTSFIGNKNIKFSSLNKVISAKMELRCTVAPAYLNTEKSSLHSISENITTQLNNLTK